MISQWLECIASLVPEDCSYNSVSKAFNSLTSTTTRPRHYVVSFHVSLPENKGDPTSSSHAVVAEEVVCLRAIRCSIYGITRDIYKEIHWLYYHALHFSQCRLREGTSVKLKIKVSLNQLGCFECEISYFVVTEGSSILCVCHHPY